MKQRPFYVFRLEPAELDQAIADARVLKLCSQILGCYPDEVPHHVRQLRRDHAKLEQMLRAEKEKPDV